MSKMVLIEYTEDVESAAGRADEDEKKSSIAKGTRRRVDAVSARKLTQPGKDSPARAKLVEDDVAEAEADPAPRAGRRGGRPSEPSANSPAETGGENAGEPAEGAS